MPDLSKLPSIPITEKNKLPKCMAVYIAYEGSKVLYIGKANNLKHRWRKHHKHDALCLLGKVRIAWIEVDSINQLVATECEFIKRFTPLLNEAKPSNFVNISTAIFRSVSSSLGLEMEAAPLGLTELEFIVASGAINR